METFFKKMNWDANAAVETLEISKKESQMSTSWHETEMIREMNQMEKFGTQLHEHNLDRIKNKNRLEAKMERLLIGAKRKGANTRMHTQQRKKNKQTGVSMSTLDQATKGPCTPLSKAEAQIYRVDFHDEKQSAASTLNFGQKGESQDKSGSTKRTKIN